MKKNAPTLHDVAKAAGVSTATVSKHLNGTQRFSANVEATINAAVAELGYRSNVLARAMITGETKTIGVSILDINNPHFTAVVKGANRVAIEAGYTLLLDDTEENQGRELQLLDTLSRRVDGLIVSSRMPETDIKTIVDYGKPIVIFWQTGCGASGMRRQRWPSWRLHARAPPCQSRTQKHCVPRIFAIKMGCRSPQRHTGMSWHA
jgi:LacI family transcriptional regulator